MRAVIIDDAQPVVGTLGHRDPARRHGVLRDGGRDASSAGSDERKALVWPVSSNAPGTTGGRTAVEARDLRGDHRCSRSSSSTRGAASLPHAPAHPRGPVLVRRQPRLAQVRLPVRQVQEGLPRADDGQLLHPGRRRQEPGRHLLRLEEPHLPALRHADQGARCLKKADLRGKETLLSQSRRGASARPAEPAAGRAAVAAPRRPLRGLHGALPGRRPALQAAGRRRAGAGGTPTTSATSSGAASTTCIRGRLRRNSRP